MEVFEQHDYVVVDAIRPEIWSNPEVEWWYAQNLLMFVHETHLASTAALAQHMIERRPVNYPSCIRENILSSSTGTLKSTGDSVQRIMEVNERDEISHVGSGDVF